MDLFNLMGMRTGPERHFLVSQGANLYIDELAGLAVIKLNKSGLKFEQRFTYSDNENFYAQLKTACAILYWELINDGFDL